MSTTTTTTMTTTAKMSTQFKAALHDVSCELRGIAISVHDPKYHSNVIHPECSPSEIFKFIRRVCWEKFPDDCASEEMQIATIREMYASLNTKDNQVKSAAERKVVKVTPYREYGLRYYEDPIYDELIKTASDYGHSLSRVTRRVDERPDIMEARDCLKVIYTIMRESHRFGSTREFNMLGEDQQMEVMDRTVKAMADHSIISLNVQKFFADAIRRADGSSILEASMVMCASTGTMEVHGHVVSLGVDATQPVSALPALADAHRKRSREEDDEDEVVFVKDVKNPCVRIDLTGDDEDI
jgi:hypothetical protein